MDPRSTLPLLLLAALVLSGCAATAPVAGEDPTSAALTTLAPATTAPKTEAAAPPRANATLPTTTTTSAAAPPELVASAGGPYKAMAFSRTAVAAQAAGAGPGASCAWTASAGTFADPEACATVYRAAAPGTAELAVTVTDGGREAKATAKVEVAVPASDGSVVCEQHLYTKGLFDAQSTANEVDKAGTYLRGMDYDASCRFTEGDGVDASTPATLYILDAAGQPVLGPFAADGAADDPGFSFSTSVTLPKEMAKGTYLFAMQFGLAADTWAEASMGPTVGGLLQFEVADNP